MRVIAAHVAIKKDRYLVGYVVVNDEQVEHAFSFGAPKDESEASQYQELYARTLAVLEEKNPDHFTLRQSEIPSGTKRIAAAHRAEGALLAAAGHIRGLPVSTWVRASLVKPAGSVERTAEAVAAALAARLANPPDPREQRQAAVAAAAVLVTAGAL
jgi:hypothetical protein